MEVAKKLSCQQKNTADRFADRIRLLARLLTKSEQLFGKEILQRNGRANGSRLWIIVGRVICLRIGKRVRGLTIVDQLPVQFGRTDFINEGIDLLARHRWVLRTVQHQDSALDVGGILRRWCVERTVQRSNGLHYRTRTGQLQSGSAAETETASAQLAVELHLSLALEGIKRGIHALAQFSAVLFEWRDGIHGLLRIGWTHCLAINVGNEQGLCQANSRHRYLQRLLADTKEIGHRQHAGHRCGNGFIEEQDTFVLNTVELMADECNADICGSNADDFRNRGRVKMMGHARFS